MRSGSAAKARAVAVALSGSIARHCGNQGARRQDVAQATVQPRVEWGLVGEPLQKSESGSSPSQAHNAEVVQDKITTHVLMAQCGPVSFRTTKELMFAQMATTNEKEALVDSIRLSSTHDILKEILLPSNGSGVYFSRLPVKLELSNLNNAIKLDEIKALIESLISSGGKLLSIKDSRPNTQTGLRTVSFRVNSIVFSDIFGTINGIVPYQDGRVKGNLFFRINCRPWQCRDCFYIGHHEKREGKVCTKCGSLDHQVKACNKKTRFCRNCKRPGHSARDAHCPRYLNEVAKELRKHDLLLEYLEDAEKIGHLFKQIQLK